MEECVVVKECEGDLRGESKECGVDLGGRGRRVRRRRREAFQKGERKREGRRHSKGDAFKEWQRKRKRGEGGRSLEGREGRGERGEGERLEAAKANGGGGRGGFGRGGREGGGGGGGGMKGRVPIGSEKEEEDGRKETKGREEIFSHFVHKKMLRSASIPRERIGSTIVQ